MRYLAFVAVLGSLAWGQIRFPKAGECYMVMQDLSTIPIACPSIVIGDPPTPARGYVSIDWPKPEPMDVPAEEWSSLTRFIDGNDMGKDADTFVTTCHVLHGKLYMVNGTLECSYKRPPTCSDKSRILLTSEDGQKHCVKFPKESN